MIKRTACLCALLTAILLMSGCSKWMGGLRRDFDDSELYGKGPTSGGTWSERGLLSEDMESEELPERYNAVGHSERNPASGSWRDSPGRGSWVTEDQAAAARRDRRRMAVAEEGAEAGAEQAAADGARRAARAASRATRADFVDSATSEGSLWASDGQTNYFFTKNKVRGVGDIVSITIEAELLRDIALELARGLSPQEREIEIAAAQERLKQDSAGGGKGSDQVQSSSAAPDRAPAGGSAAATGYNSQAKSNASSSGEVREATAADIDVSKSMGTKAGEVIMTEIVERYPNGNYKVRGTKKVPYRNGNRLVSVVAVVRGSEIAEDDTTPSGKLYEYRLQSLR